MAVQTMKARAPNITPLVYPILRAYLFGYASIVSPRLFQILLSRARKSNPETRDTLAKILTTLKKATELHRFPAFCGITVGGWRLLQPVFERVLAYIFALSGSQKDVAKERKFATFFASLISGAVGMRILNLRPRDKAKAGRTLDLTLIGVARALDVIIGSAWLKWKTYRKKGGSWTKLENLIGKNADAMAFSFSSGIIMFAFIYLPEKLPRAYNKWIDGMAEIDSRVLTALRRIRAGEYVYGKDTGQGPLLGSYCVDLGLPYEMGDPTITVPIPCRLVHGGWTESCELHAIWRVWNGWKSAFSMYLPLNLVVKLRNPTPKNLLRAVWHSTRSSAFLGAFVAIFYYAICLTRTRLGPKLFPKFSPMFWDKQFIITMACLVCGSTVLIEAPKRRPEMSFFVAPRALAVFLPRTYSRENLWREVAAYALSFAVVMTAVREDRTRVRGVFGRVLGKIVEY